MADTLSEYELKRLKTIAENAAKFAAMGFDEVRLPVQPKVKRAKEPKPQPRGPSRSSRRLTGEGPSDVAGAPEELREEWRDPNDVSQMTQTEKRSWCDQLREEVRISSSKDGPVFAILTDEQRARLDAANRPDDEGGWLGQFVWFTSQFDMDGEKPLSKDNIKSVLKQIMFLVSGAGVKGKEGCVGRFAADRPLRLGITAEEVDDLRAEAQLWCPMPSAAKDIVGRIVHGVEVPPTPPAGSPIDTGKGWLLNHPLKKMQIYCQFVDECNTNGFKPTLHRLMGIDADADADGEEDGHGHGHGDGDGDELDEAPPPPSKAARKRKGGKGGKGGKAAASKPSARARWAEGGEDTDDECVVPDGEGEEAVAPARKRVRERPKPRAKPAAAASAKKEEEDDDDDDDDDEAPLSKRLKPTA